jgi:hypothetical protein
MCSVYLILPAAEKERNRQRVKLSDVLQEEAERGKSLFKIIHHIITAKEQRMDR